MQNKPHLFFLETGVPKRGGRGGGGPTLGKNSQKILFFFLDSVPNFDYDDHDQWSSTINIIIIR